MPSWGQRRKRGDDEVLRTYAYDYVLGSSANYRFEYGRYYGMNCFVYEGNLIKIPASSALSIWGVICRDEF